MGLRGRVIAAPGLHIFVPGGATHQEVGEDEYEGDKQNNRYGDHKCFHDGLLSFWLGEVPSGNISSSMLWKTGLVRDNKAMRIARIIIVVMINSNTPKSSFPDFLMNKNDPF